ncbi:MAG: transketolase [Candidatus Omnitrophica bacterium]|nr:transketolase [Candidatus Omnitrophota bacterium]MBU1128942.1 transketolase [Candidatus Omnitrophota bacterium]MBU1656551.1 transketolase [Candidatus Omnitrophota bacterium]MBU1784113.1 transketolase [Candidatus Omnitrophota bacterium]MBU1850843.1 transketolase [Candidatus Omnitrophota bacterium]
MFKRFNERWEVKKITDITELKKKAIDLRRDTLKMLTKAGSGHTGGSLSVIEIMALLYYQRMNIDNRDPRRKDRDKFILSKGHACPALYAILADLDFFPREELWTLRKLGSRLQGHPQLGLPGVEISSGSLGQGLSISVGMALADRMDDLNTRIYCLMGDGETNEGQVWEAAMTAAHYKLASLCGIIDCNKLQIDGRCCEVMNPGAHAKKWESFRWHVIEADGHDFKELQNAFDEAAAVLDRPQMIIAHTVKGKGISFIENQVAWHGIAPKKDELNKAFAELDKQRKALDG